MKKISLLASMAMLFVIHFTVAQPVSQAIPAMAENKTTAAGPVAKFDKTVFDFQTLVQNSPGTASFILTNEGNEPLIISKATASCGCTNLSYEKEPIMPGKSTVISATYNAAALGVFTKTITVITNASEQPVILQIKGKVEAKS